MTIQKSMQKINRDESRVEEIIKKYYESILKTPIVQSHLNRERKQLERGCDIIIH